MSSHFIGIDIGTGSARAGVFDEAGAMLASAKADIATWHAEGHIVEQSSNDIWRAVATTVREAVSLAGISAQSVHGIGFDATCSLVVLGPGGEPLTVSPSGDPERNIIVWMDHRATEQARRINGTGEDVLRYVGGTISPEMETPKLLWLAENMPRTFAAAWQFMDLADFLTWRATGSLARSTCTVTCKWTYLAHEARWDDGYFRKVGLGALADEEFARIGTEVVAPGSALPDGLRSKAAAELGLLPGTPVAAGMIDAHAGGIGSVGARGGAGDVTTRMAYVFGTSACTMTTTEQAAFVPGVWGPYFSAMVPGLWLNEGGQSAAGAAIDRLVGMHPAAVELAGIAARGGQNLSQWLAQEAERHGGAAKADRLVGGLHVVPEFLGNRAPLANPDARGLVAGLDMATGADSLVALYVAGLCGLGYGARQILAAMHGRGINIDTIAISGGAGQSPLVRQLIADSTGKVVYAPTSPEPVLLGSAMLGAVAAGRYFNLPAAMAAMSEVGEVYSPNAALAACHDRRFAAFERLQAAALSVLAV
ncbi:MULTISPECIES: FGGY-family carbohydrate kinase [unclassified Mesorhizobium]|uniref:FGGY-family carbohydrate kinase n=3 Tax=Mesorhizobium TaxID=68287 RepID=UPI000FCBD66F|nr:MULTISPECIES: FGGY-family carbohydrate kinase [unclassified Mesorhizobium]RUV94888.1 ribulokinase [Mesorhizobium sp. M1A.F.Ca.IN.020.04.1.1]RWG13068.1 MAG: ribulokinase [Mesorhizobium sp.]RWG32590.1 MAG: ribulokinase [Mesorhizobium sp.]RWH13613.1 MAG: ribulokinase [Mesorhizobium sp.]RWN09921.1 MAG: ribulokinase [Mesorhizobium sp.]